MFNKIGKYLIIIFGFFDIAFLSILVLSSLNISIRDNMVKSLFSSSKGILYTLVDEEDVSKVLLSEEDNSKKSAVVIELDSDNSDNYDEDILMSDNNDYKYLKIKIGGYDAHLVAIYDPSKIRLVTSSAFNTGNSQEYLIDMCNREGASVCINGGGFVDYGTGSDIPFGYLIRDGKVIWKDSDNPSSLISFTNDNKLLLVTANSEEAIKKGVRDALEFGPFLIVDGVEQEVYGSVGGYSGAARVAIGQRKDGIVLFIVTEGIHGNGPTMKDLIETFKLYGAYNAANLDGGASSQLVIDGKLINHPLNVFGQNLLYGRRIVSGFGLFLD